MGVWCVEEIRRKILLWKQALIAYLLVLYACITGTDHGGHHWIKSDNGGRCWNLPLFWLMAPSAPPVALHQGPGIRVLLHDDVDIRE